MRRGSVSRSRGASFCVDESWGPVPDFARRAAWIGQTVDVTETDIILWTGVSVGLVGLAATASNGVALILRRIRQGAATARRWIDHQLTRIFPSRRKHVTVVPLTATAAATVSVSAMAYVTVTPPPDAPIELQLDAIRRNFDALQGRLQRLEEQSQSRHSALSSSLDALTSEVREGLATLISRLDVEASDTARTDARGLGPVAFGFVMVAVPNQLASVPLFGAFFTVAALFVTAAITRLVFPGVLRSSRA